MIQAVPNRTPHVRVMVCLFLRNVCRTFGEEISFVV